MFSSFAVASFFLAGAVSGQGLDQLETARLTQAAQRGEFGVDGDASAFLFSFADPVRSPHSAPQPTNGVWAPHSWICVCRLLRPCI